MKTLLIIFGMLLLYSCNEETAANTSTTTEASVSITDASAKNTKNGTYLCQINGEDWHYTKASGLVFIEKTTGIKMAMITFKKQLEKGSESIQVEYNVENNSLFRVLVNIKRINKEGKRIGAHYNVTENTITKNPEMMLFGTIDISNPNTASGTADFKVENSYEKKILENPEDLLIHVSNLNFSGVGYSDLNKTFN